jgi:hypothetical protein
VSKLFVTLTSSRMVFSLRPPEQSSMKR